MKKNILAMLAVAVLAGPMAAQASVIYSLTYDGSSDFLVEYTSPDFITTDLLLAVPTDNLTCDLTGFGFYEATCTGADFLLNTFGVFDGVRFNYNGTQTTVGFTDGAFSTPGTHGPGTFHLSVTSVPTAVSEAGTFGLFGLALATLGFARRRTTR